MNRLLVVGAYAVLLCSCGAQAAGARSTPAPSSPVPDAQATTAAQQQAAAQATAAAQQQAAAQATTAAQQQAAAQATAAAQQQAAAQATAAAQQQAAAQKPAPAAGPVQAPSGAPAAPAQPPPSPTQAVPAPPKPAGGTVAAQIVDFEFKPSGLTIAAGTTVVWTNVGPTAHNVFSTDGSWQSPILQSGGTYSHTFAAAGTFPIICTLHPYMTGVVTVK